MKLARSNNRFYISRPIGTSMDRVHELENYIYRHYSSREHNSVRFWIENSTYSPLKSGLETANIVVVILPGYAWKLGVSSITKGVLSEIQHAKNTGKTLLLAYWREINGKKEVRVYTMTTEGGGVYFGLAGTSESFETPEIPIHNQFSPEDIEKCKVNYTKNIHINSPDSILNDPRLVLFFN